MVLIETYSWEREEGRLLEALAEKLAPHVTLRPIPVDQVIKVGFVDSFSSLVGTFLRHFKNGGYGIDDCAGRATLLKMKKRAEAFLKIFGAVHREYETRVGDRIDFEDMVLRATAHVESGRYESRFRHILVDEFQDISTGRARLIRALKAQHADARVFEVGDDWQSIYRFAGSDIHIMRNFGREFGGRYAGASGVHRTVDLGRTFRSADKIALAARRFVLRNPAQITKTVVPAGEAERPAVRIAWTRRETGDNAIDECLSSLAAMKGPGDRAPTILLLGRYRFMELGLRRLRRQHPGLSISYKTIHASKGLEADHVVILGADNARMGGAHFREFRTNRPSIDRPLETPPPPRIGTSRSRAPPFLPRCTGSRLFDPSPTRERRTEKPTPSAQARRGTPPTRNSACRLFFLFPTVSAEKAIDRSPWNTEQTGERPCPHNPSSSHSNAFWEGRGNRPRASPVRRPPRASRCPGANWGQSGVNPRRCLMPSHPPLATR